MIRQANDYDVLQSAISSTKPLAVAFVNKGARTFWLVELTLETLERRMPEILILMIDTWENPVISKKFGRGSPSLALFVKGRHMGTTEDMGLTRLLDFIRGAIA
jgi:hypothetical protein